MDFDFQVKLFTDQLVELLDDAKAEASREFAVERDNHEQRVRELEADVAHWTHVAAEYAEKAEAAEQKYLTLQAKLSALV